MKQGRARKREVRRCPYDEGKSSGMCLQDTTIEVAVILKIVTYAPVVFILEAEIEHRTTLVL